MDVFQLTESDIHLLNKLQSGFPVCHDPFAQLAEELNCGSSEIIDRLKQLQSSGVIRRFGAVLNHKRAGASTLAALKVPLEKIDEVAELVNSFKEVNHNYLREHSYNLWFVVTAKTQARVDEVLSELKAKSACDLLNLPMVKSHHINLAFDL